jgi:hypothetical protein
MEILQLREERTRLSEEYRAKLAALAILRSQLAEAVSADVHRHICQTVDREAELCRKLGAKLLELDGLIISTQARAREREATELTPLQTGLLPAAGVFPID